MKLKRLLFILATNALVLGIGLLGLELVFGDWVKADNLNKLNIIKSKTVQYDVAELYDGPSPITYTRDEHGLRGRFGHPSEIEILTVGGSTTDQRYIADGETWQDVIQELFAASGARVVVANAGVDGQSTYGHIKNFDWWFPHVPGLKPRYILYYVGLNDLHRGEGLGWDALVREQNRRSIRSQIRNKSALYHLYRTARGNYDAQVVQGIGHHSTDFSDVQWTRSPLHDSYDDLMRARLQEYAERLEMLVRRTREMGATPREMGATPVFVTQPGRRYRFRDGELEGITIEVPYGDVPINGVDYYHMLRRLDDVTMSVCRQHGGICIDPARNLTWDDDDFYDFLHLTPKGTRKVGRYMFEQLQPVSAFGPASDSS